MLMMLISDKRQLQGNIEQIGFHIALNTSKCLSDLTDSGRLFHTVVPATEKARSANLVLVRGTIIKS